MIFSRNLRALFLLPVFCAPFFALSPASVQAQSADKGGALFKARCAMCHTTRVGAAAGLAPNLWGVGGRKAGATGFQYTGAMKASNIVWTRKSLDKLLADPGKTVPGTAMAISVPNAKERGAIVAYLLSLKS